MARSGWLFSLGLRLVVFLSFVVSYCFVVLFVCLFCELEVGYARRYGRFSFVVRDASGEVSE